MQPGNDQCNFGVVRHFVVVGATLRCCCLRGKFQDLLA